MAARRLSDSEKQELVGRYKAGESTAALAETFGCSPNTVSRTVKALLPPEAYAALKASRQKGGTVAVAAQPLLEIPPLDVPSSVDAASAESATPAETSAEELSADESSSLALDDAADFAEASDDQGSALEELVPMDVFTELVPLIGVAGLSGSAPMETQPLSPGVLPDSVYTVSYTHLTLPTKA